MPQGSISQEDDHSSGNIFSGSGLPRGRRTRRSRRCYTSDAAPAAAAALAPAALALTLPRGPSPPREAPRAAAAVLWLTAAAARAATLARNPAAQSQPSQGGAMRSCWGAASGQGRGGSGIGGSGQSGSGDSSRGQADGRRLEGEGLGDSAPAAGGEGFVWPRKGKIGRPRASAPKARPCFAFLALYCSMPCLLVFQAGLLNQQVKEGGCKQLTC